MINITKIGHIYMVIKKPVSMMALIFPVFLFISSCFPEAISVINEESNSYISPQTTCGSCNFVVGTSDYQFDGQVKNVQPGDTIGIPAGARGPLYIHNIVGTPDNPVVIINCGGVVNITNPTGGYGIKITNSKYFRLTGTGYDGIKYGINISSANTGSIALLIEQLSTNLEVDHIEVAQSGSIGIACRTNASCDGTVSINTFTQYDTQIHDNNVHDTQSEGYYIGGSHWGTGQAYQPGCVGTLLYEPELKKVRVYNNISNNTGWDGIQVGSAVSDCEIYNNVVTNYGLAGKNGDQSGFQINPGTTGKLYSNQVRDGTGYGIFMAGRGDNTVYSNLVVNAGRDAIIAVDRMPTPGMGFYFINNDIIKPVGYALCVYTNQTSGNVFYNNIISQPGSNGFRYMVSGYSIDTANNYWISNTGAGVFVNPSLDDYHLVTGSPAVNTGKNVKSFGVVEDLDMILRPKGAYDIGAYEVQ